MTVECGLLKVYLEDLRKVTAVGLGVQDWTESSQTRSSSDNHCTEMFSLRYFEARRKTEAAKMVGLEAYW